MAGLGILGYSKQTMYIDEWMGNPILPVSLSRIGCIAYCYLHLSSAISMFPDLMEHGKLRLMQKYFAPRIVHISHEGDVSNEVCA